jgi:hypothetical protein
MMPEKFYAQCCDASRPKAVHRFKIVEKVNRHTPATYDVTLYSYCTVCGHSETIAEWFNLDCVRSTTLFYPDRR